MGGKGQGAIVSLVERRSRYTLLGNVDSKQAEEVGSKTIGLLSPHKEYTETITADNGKEVAHHITIGPGPGRLGVFRPPLPCLGAGPQRKYQRADSPVSTQRKGTAVDTLSEGQVLHLMDRLNHRP